MLFFLVNKELTDQWPDRNYRWDNQTENTERKKGSVREENRDAEELACGENEMPSHDPCARR